VEEIKNEYEVLAGKYEEKTSFWLPIHKRKDSTKRMFQKN
jgi:hypothetical protein